MLPTAPKSKYPIRVNWEPFVLSDKPPRTRAITTAEGIGDRMRAAAFAELQAREAFKWAASHFPDAPDGLRRGWRTLVVAEQRHYDWIMNRMLELGISVAERPVSDWLWQSLSSCKTAKEFAIFIANAEERGRHAALRFYDAMNAVDPKTAEIFNRIAAEEVSHVELAKTFFPDYEVAP